MLKVLLDARKLGDGGIGVYLENLILGLSQLVPQDELALTLIVDSQLKNSDQSNPFIASLPGNVAVINDAASRYSLNEYLAMPIRLKKLLRRADIFHSPHYTLPFFMPCKSVITVHDVIHYTFPDTRWHRAVGGKLIQSGLQRADAVLTVSDRSKEQIVGNFQVERNKVVTIPNALQPWHLSDFAASEVELSKVGVSKSFALFIGSSRPHKGLITLLVAWSILQHWRSKQGMQQLQLVVVGKLNASLRSEIVARRLEQVVVVLENVDAAKLRALYHGATLSVIASVEEGFGFVALESMASGCPLVTTPLPSVKEIAQDNAFYAEGFSAQDIFYALKRCLETESQQLSVMRDRGKRLAQMFDLPRFVASTVAAYRRVFQGEAVASRDGASDQEREFSW